MPETLRDTLDFLHDLRANNNKQWFDFNRKRYDKARGQFEDFLTDLIYNFGAIEDLSGVTAKECMFRINRDIRFSADKTPYKTSMAAVLGQGGRKAQGRTYYLHLEPDGNSVIAGGLWSPDSAQLDKMRRSIADNSKPLKAIIERASFVKFFGPLSGERLKSAPQGYPKEHPDLELLRFKQFVVHHPFTDTEILAPEFTTNVLAGFKEMKPFVSYIHDVLAL